MSEKKNIEPSELEQLNGMKPQHAGQELNPQSAAEVQPKPVSAKSTKSDTKQYIVSSDYVDFRISAIGKDKLATQNWQNILALLNTVGVKLTVSGVDVRLEVDTVTLQHVRSRKTYSHAQGHITVLDVLKLLKLNTPIKDIIKQSGYAERTFYRRLDAHKRTDEWAKFLQLNLDDPQIIEMYKAKLNIKF